MGARSGGSTGIIYVSFGESYRDLTTLSICALRRFGYSGPVRILSDNHDWDIGHLDCELLEVPSAGEGFGTRFYKTQVNEYGFDTTLFLDADTLAIAPIGHIWRELRFSEICMSLDIHPDVGHLIKKGRKDRERRRFEYTHMQELGLIDHPFFNSGVMLFRRTAAVDQLFKVWHEEWDGFQGEDQLALVRAMSRTGMYVHTLSSRWNERLRKFGSVDQAQRCGVRILHLRPGSEPLLPTIFAEYAQLGLTKKPIGAALQ
jgi:hypothetical protein